MLRNFLKWCHIGTSVKVGLPVILLPLLNRGGLDMRDGRSFSFFRRVPYVILRVMKRENLLQLQKSS
jgi:hypothetical protein